MTLIYDSYDLSAIAVKYGDSISPRVVSGPNPLDSIAGTHEPDDLKYKEDVIIKCWPLTGTQLNLLRTLASGAISAPYKNLLYVSGDVTVSGKYKISISPATNVIYTSEHKFYGGVVITFEAQ